MLFCEMLSRSPQQETLYAHAGKGIHRPQSDTFSLFQQPLPVCHTKTVRTQHPLIALSGEDRQMPGGIMIDRTDDIIVL